MPYNGRGSGLTGRSLARPIGTVTAADRWAVVDGDRMRMLAVDELRAAMGFREGYALPAQRCHATMMLGNAIVPAVAESAVRAVMEAA
jgi:DNA (cytosine-5)-methyltransferase 1